MQWKKVSGLDEPDLERPPLMRNNVHKPTSTRIACATQYATRFYALTP